MSHCHRMFPFFFQVCKFVNSGFFYFGNILLCIKVNSCPFQTEFCGWGVEAAEPINKGEFIIEYIGEGSFNSWPFCFYIYVWTYWRIFVHFFIIITHINWSCLFLSVIDDALCEQRLWDMKYRGVQNFYMCEIRKDFTIDATFKGNFSRFLNHSCDPNCFLEKWLVWLMFAIFYILQ